ncbi:GDYXXLXY domain-containing protein [Chitinilyticum litopenaei]|uniref:GDYXXLXY domain-containing protein n=1 Tax=Chitinilyticum litopenaei TaxID=1121276 RepID=UPI00040659F8|nr:GDYXXLXY domain-containing protein [Chitinilyticum litopenaei]
MNRMLLPVLAIIATLLVLNIGVYRHEQLLQKGSVVYLPLAPVDPRSLLQGDYMALNYALVRDVDRSLQQHAGRHWPDYGTLQVLLRLDARRVGTPVWVGTGAPEPGHDELRLRVKIVNGYRIMLPSHAYFFGEGEAERYSRARYAILRVSKEGRSLLAGLADEQLKPL